MVFGGIKKAIDQLYPTRSSQSKLNRQLLNLESSVGSTVFGKQPKGHRRDFYVLDAHTIIWNEAWRDGRNREQMIRTRYELYPDKIVKAQDNEAPRFISKEEANQLLVALRYYHYFVATKVYGKPA